MFETNYTAAIFTEEMISTSHHEGNNDAISSDGEYSNDVNLVLLRYFDRFSETRNLQGF